MSFITKLFGGGTSYGDSDWGTQKWFNQLTPEEQAQHNKDYEASHAAAVAKDEEKARKEKEKQNIIKYKQEITDSINKSNTERDYLQNIISGKDSGYLQKKAGQIAQQQREATQSFANSIGYLTDAQRQGFTNEGLSNIESRLSAALEKSKIQDLEFAQKQINAINAKNASLVQGLQATSETELARVWENARKMATENEISNYEKEAQAAADKYDLFGRLISGGTQATAMTAILSDKNAKEDIKNSDSETQDFLDNLQAYEYNYKGKSDKNLGVMAQDVEKSNAGKEIVTDLNGYKALDKDKVLSALLASVANLNKRIREIE